MANWQRTPEAQVLVDRVAAKVLSPEIRAYVQSVYPECDFSARAYKRLNPIIGFNATVAANDETACALYAMCGWGAYLDRWMKEHLKFKRMLDRVEELDVSSALFNSLSTDVSSPDLSSSIQAYLTAAGGLGAAIPAAAIGVGVVPNVAATMAQMAAFPHLAQALALCEGVYLDLSPNAPVFVTNSANLAPNPALPVVNAVAAVAAAGGNPAVAAIPAIAQNAAFGGVNAANGLLVFGEAAGQGMRSPLGGAASIALEDIKSESQLVQNLKLTGRLRDAYIGKLLMATKQTGVRAEIMRMYNELSQAATAKAAAFMGYGAATFVRGIRQAYPQCAPGMELKLFDYKGFPAKQGAAFDPTRTRCVPVAAGLGGQFAARKYHRAHHALPRRNAKGQFVKSHRAPAKRAPAHRRPAHSGYRASVVADPAFDWKPASSLSVPKRLPFNAAAQLYQPRINYRAMSLLPRPYSAMMLDRPMASPLKSMLLKADQARKKKCSRCNYHATTRAQASRKLALVPYIKPKSKSVHSKKPAHAKKQVIGVRRKKKWEIGAIKTICGKKYKLGYSKKVGPNGKRSRVWHVLHPKKVQKRKVGDKKMICGKMRVLSYARKPKRSLKPGEHRRKVWHVVDKKKKKH